MTSLHFWLFLLLAAASVLQRSSSLCLGHNKPLCYVLLSRLCGRDRLRHAITCAAAHIPREGVLGIAGSPMIFLEGSFSVQMEISSKLGHNLNL